MRSPRRTRSSRAHSSIRSVDPSARRNLVSSITSGSLSMLSSALFPSTLEAPCEVVDARSDAELAFRVPARDSATASSHSSVTMMYLRWLSVQSTFPHLPKNMYLRSRRYAPNSNDALIIQCDRILPRQHNRLASTPHRLPSLAFSSPRGGSLALLLLQSGVADDATGSTTVDEKTLSRTYDAYATTRRRRIDNQARCEMCQCSMYKERRPRQEYGKPEEERTILRK